jgi:hypothetical protein
MLHKSGKWFADWRENGKRHRKAFKTKQAAQSFQTRKRKELAGKARPTAKSPGTPKRGPKRIRKTRTPE